MSDGAWQVSCFRQDSRRMGPDDHFDTVAFRHVVLDEHGVTERDGADRITSVASLVRTPRRAANA